MLTVIGRWKQLSILALATASLSVAAAQTKPETVSERVNGASSPHKDVEERVKAIESLGTISKDEESDNRVIEALLEIAKEKDIFVRIPAIKTLGRINQNVTKDNKAKTKYLEPFVAILKDTKEHVMVRSAVAGVFKNTLDPKSLPDVDKAFKPGILAIATNKGEKAILLRAECIRAVGEFGDASRIEELAAILSEPDPPQEIREAAADAIYALLNKAQQVNIPVPTVNKLVEMVSDEKLPNEMRVRVMKLVAQLLREENTTAKNSNIMAVIVKTVEKADKDFMIKGAVEALGIIGSGEAVIPLKKTYEELIKPNPDPTLGPSAPGNVEIRVAIMRALRSVLSVQTSKKNPDMKAVSEAVTLLIRAAAGLKDVPQDPAPAVQDAAVFSLRYVYPFESEHEDVVFALIFVIRENKNEEFKKKAAETLSYISQVDFGLDYQRWFDWFEKRYPKGKKRAEK